MRVHPLAELSHHARRRGRPWPSSRAVDGRAGPDRRAGLPDGRAAPGHGRRGARGGRARRRRALPGGRRAAGARRPATPTDDELDAAHRRTASCTCSATTTPSPTRSAEMFGLQRQLLLTCLARPRPAATVVTADRRRDAGSSSRPSLRRARRPARRAPRPRSSRDLPASAPRSWSREGRRGAPALVAGRRRPAPRYLNLLLLLRLVCELAATVLVTLVVRRRLRRRPGRRVAGRRRRRWSSCRFVVVGVAPAHPRPPARRRRSRWPRRRSCCCAGPGARPAAAAADPARQRAHPGQGLPRGPVRLRGRAARAGRPGRGEPASSRPASAR